MEFSSNISLRKEDLDRFQFVYDTQIYQTFFGLYARFDATLDSASNKTKINRIDFIGINYKGLLNLEIINIIHRVTNDSGLCLDLKVRAAMSIRPKTDFSLDLSKKSVLIENGDYLRIIRELIPMYKYGSKQVLDRAFVQGCFDTEFFVRDGMFVKERSENLAGGEQGRNTNHNGSIDFGEDDYIGDKIPLDRFPIPIPLEIKSPGIRCTPGVSKFLF